MKKHPGRENSLSSNLIIRFSRLSFSKNINGNVRCLPDSAVSEDCLKDSYLTGDMSLLTYRLPIIQETT